MFARLPRMDVVLPAFIATLQAGTWRERQASLAMALDEILNMQRAVGFPDPPSGHRALLGPPLRPPR